MTSIKAPALSLLLSICVLLTPAHAADRLALATGEYEPFTGESLPDGGPLTEMVRQAFAEAGFEVRIDFLPWKRGYAAALDGQYDATFPYGRNADREKDFLFSESFFTLERRMYYRAASGINPEDPSTLKGKTYCSPVGYTLYKELGGMVEQKEITVQTAPNHGSCAKMLDAGRVDFFITTADAAAIAFAKAGLKRRPSDKTFGKSENHLLVARTHPRAPELIAAFNRGVAALKSKGQWSKIIAQHKIQ